MVKHKTSEWVSSTTQNELTDEAPLHLSKKNPSEISDKIRSTLELLFGQVNKNKLNLTTNDMFNANTRNIKPDQNEVENLFNIQYAKLNTKVLKPEDEGSCRCPRDTNHIKLSARLKKSDQEYPESNPGTSPFNCQCQGNTGNKIIGGLGSKKLKMTVRL